MLVLFVLLIGIVYAMNLWISYYPTSSFGNKELMQGQEFLADYGAECGSSDNKTYLMDMYADGNGSIFLQDLPIQTEIWYGTSYKYYYKFKIPANASIGSYQFQICCSIREGLWQLIVCTKNYDLTIIENPNLCTPNWQCNEWSKCIKRTQNRTCIDLNNCGGEKPNETQKCPVRKYSTKSRKSKQI